MVSIQIGRKIFRQLRFHALSEPQHLVMGTRKACISGNYERLPVGVKTACPLHQAMKSGATPRMNERARTVCNVKLKMENGLLGLVEFVEIHIDPPRWEVRRKYSLDAGGVIRSLPPPEMFA